jgi:hypothetical protein
MGWIPSLKRLHGTMMPAAAGMYVGTSSSLFLVLLQRKSRD